MCIDGLALQYRRLLSYLLVSNVCRPTFLQLTFLSQSLDLFITVHLKKSVNPNISFETGKSQISDRLLSILECKVSNARCQIYPSHFPR